MRPTIAHGSPCYQSVLQDIDSAEITTRFQILPGPTERLPAAVKVPSGRAGPGDQWS